LSEAAFKENEEVLLSGDLVVSNVWYVKSAKFCPSIDRIRLNSGRTWNASILLTRAKFPSRPTTLIVLGRSNIATSAVDNDIVASDKDSLINSTAGNKCEISQKIRHYNINEPRTLSNLTTRRILGPSVGYCSTPGEGKGLVEFVMVSFAFETNVAMMKS
jgi:hypothetical protein